MEQKKILAFVIEENSKMECNSEDGCCRLLGLFSSKAEADESYKKEYGSLNTYDGYNGHYIKYIPLSEENKIANIEVANWWYAEP